MKKFEVVFETTLPPWQLGYEEIEADDPTSAKEKFRREHDYSKRLLEVNEIIWSESIYG